MAVSRDKIVPVLGYARANDGHKSAFNLAPNPTQQPSPGATAMIQLSVNGESRTLPQGMNLAALIDELALAGKKIAVERNGDIVPRSAYGKTMLEAGDQLEIVVAVGGG